MFSHEKFVNSVYHYREISFREMTSFVFVGQTVPKSGTTWYTGRQCGSVELCLIVTLMWPIAPTHVNLFRQVLVFPLSLCVGVSLSQPIRN
ncbi:hypothetical protein XENTR_v10012033 [Xenopus tropicalis]|nr:hypothetical protein XENTR_v10012033 [Xenopus tropicalis]